MEQLICHLLGDYFLQTDKQAMNKYKSWGWTIIHVCTYTLPFLFLTTNLLALAIIAVTHALIDHYKLAFYICKWKNIQDDWHGVMSGKYDQPYPNTDFKSGFPLERPSFITIWLFIITDNSMHLICNFLALRYFG